MSQITEIINVTRDTAWLPWAVQYFFLIGLSVACFLFTMPRFLFGRSQADKPARLALVGALVCGLTAPVALLADLHGPGRFYHFYLYFQPSSWMAWGAWFIPIYVGGLLVYAWLALRPDLLRAAATPSFLQPLYARLGGEIPQMALKLAGGITFVGAFLVLLYTGMEVMVVAARPLWHTPFLPLQFAATAIAGGLGLMLLLNRWLGDADRELEALLNRRLALAQAVVIGLGCAWLFVSMSGVSPAHARALDQVAPSLAWQFTAAWAVLAAVVPMVLAVLRPGSSGLVTGLIVLHSAWMIRWTVFIGGQSIPKTGAGYYDYVLPLGSDGLLGIVGTAGLWIALFVVLTNWLPWAGELLSRRNDAVRSSATISLAK